MNNPGDRLHTDYRYASPEVIDRAVAGDPEACNEIREIYEEYVENYVKQVHLRVGESDFYLDLLFYHLGEEVCSD